MSEKEETIFGRKKPKILNTKKYDLSKVKELPKDIFEKMTADIKSGKKDKWEKK